MWKSFDRTSRSCLFVSPISVSRGVLSLSLLLLVLSGCGGGSAAPEPLIIEAVFPVRGSELGGNHIQVTGRNFGPGTQLFVGEKECGGGVLVSSTAITCIAPASAQGTVNIKAVGPDGRQSMITDAYTYRPSGRGVKSFGVAAAVPAQGIYDEPFTVKLESVLVGFDHSTVTRTWSVDGSAYKEGDSVTFPLGQHMVTLAIRDATGDLEKLSYSVVVGSQKVSGDPIWKSGVFQLGSDKSISMVNKGLFPVLNPRLIGVGKPDYIDWGRYLDSLSQIANVPISASEENRAELLEAAWRDLSNTTVHVCSPGREDEHIYDPVLLIRGYGYECCSNASRALAYLGSFLDIPARVRTTSYHEFPEFTVAGTTFILDPDLRFRFWGEGQQPLSAWTTASTPVSLMDVTSYSVETAGGAFKGVQFNDTFPFGSYPEEVVRGYYYNDIVTETIWDYRDAFSGLDYFLQPGEMVAFELESDYVPLQHRNDDNSIRWGGAAPKVGKVVFRQLWYAKGMRVFERDASGSSLIPLNGLPFPIQDLAIHFSGRVDPKAFWLTAGGKSYRLGDFNETTWTVSSEQLRVLTNLSDLAVVIEKELSVVAIDIGMQFNPGILGNPNVPMTLTYADDSGDCQRSIGIASGTEAKTLTLGASVCEPRAPQRTKTTYSFGSGQLGNRVISNYGNSYRGTWGVAASAGVRGYAEISLPRTPGLPGLLRSGNAGNFADWHYFDGNSWVSLLATDLSSSQWLQLPATSSAASLLRVTLRLAPVKDVTYLDSLSLVEGHQLRIPLFASMPTSAPAAVAGTVPH